MNTLPILLYALTSGNLPTPTANSSAIQTALGIAFGILGALALLMVTVSGLRYVLSSGDPQKTAQAKNGIIYSLVGLAVAITAEAIVYFVIGKL
ncbi:MAG TPA: pilin [Candidatus Dormibacteraeota bacterium]|nr:pilin [Candidatus Dormibacteraeota bacterium]